MSNVDKSAFLKSLAIILMGRGFDVYLGECNITIEKTVKNGVTESVLICQEDLTVDQIVETLQSEYDNFDVSSATYSCLDSSGHGEEGYPHDLEEVLEGKKEWEVCLEQIADVAQQVRADMMEE